MQSGDLARSIEHTLLGADAQESDVDRVCGEAARYGTLGVCLFPYYVGRARKLLENTEVRIGTVVAFPFGCTWTDTKEGEMLSAARLGADEIDCVINVSQLKSGNLGQVEEEMKRLKEVGRESGLTTKFIIETAYLTKDEKLEIIEIANRVRPDFIKTSTGFAPSGARRDDVELLRSLLLPEVGIKAAGGIRNYRQAFDLLEAGASRLGTSASIDIMRGATTE